MQSNVTEIAPDAHVAAVQNAYSTAKKPFGNRCSSCKPGKIRIASNADEHGYCILALSAILGKPIGAALAVNSVGVQHL